MSTLITLVALTVGLSFLCSLMEASLLSTTPSYIASLEETKPNLYKKISYLKTNVDSTLAAILILNTVANTAGASCIGAQVAAVFPDAPNAVPIASAIMTVLILSCSEIIPKTIGATYWQKLLGFICFILPIMMTVLKPFLKIFEFVTNLIKPKEGVQTNLREEIKAMTKMGFTEKCLDEDEYHMISNTLNLDNIKIKDLLTPRKVCSTVVKGMKISDFIKEVSQKSFSRYPVLINEDDEKFVGYVHKSSLIGKDPASTIDEMIHPILEIASSSNADYVFTEMLRTHNHISVVFDEMGTWLGILTLEDILETILGKEIVDDTDKISDMRIYAKDQWTKKLNSKKKS